MPFSNTEKISNSDKLALQLVGTGNDAPGALWGYNEKYGWSPVVKPAQLWSQFSSIPGAGNTTDADNAVAANPSILEKRIVRLTLEPTSNSRAFLCKSTFGDLNSTTFENWVQPSLFPFSGTASWGYAIQLWNGDPAGAGVQLPTTYLSGAGGSPSWQYNYAQGIITVSTDQAANYIAIYGAAGLWVQGYRYIGPTGGGASGGGMTLDVTQANSFVQGDAIYFSSTGIWTLAQSNNENTLGVALVSSPTPTSFTAIFGGPITGLSSKITGQYYFVSDTSTGKLTTTEPSTFSNPLFLALSSTGGVVLPFRPSTSGLLTVVLPEVTTAQRVALTSFAVSGSLLIDTDLEKVFRKRGSVWVGVG